MSSSISDTVIQLHIADNTDKESVQSNDNHQENSTSTGKRREPVAILSAPYFTEVTDSTEGETFKAICHSCTKKGEKTEKCIFSASKQSTSNLTTHLKRRHPDVFEQYKKSQAENEVTFKRQKTINFPVIKKTFASQRTADQLLVNFFANTMVPLSLVDHPDFKSLLLKFPSEATVPCRQTLTGKILDEHRNYQNLLRNRLKTSKWVCATADIWSSRTRSFMGVTCHWLEVDKSGWTRQSGVLAMQRFKGTHSNEKIAEMLANIFKLYQIEKKVVAVATDNASNFSAAFANYGIEFDQIIADNQEEEMEQFELVEVNLEEDTGFRLPSQIRCASHTLNLIATSDFEKEQAKETSNARGLPNYKRTLRSCFAKCSALWNKCSKSVKVIEQIKDFVGSVVVRPVPTRWNSFNDSIEWLLGKEPKLDSIFEMANVEKLQQTDIEFLRDYSNAMKPIAVALDKLQSEKNGFYGQLAPEILKAWRELTALSKSNKESSFESCMGKQLMTGVHSRFKNIIEVDLDTAKREIISAVLLPWFKLRCFKPDKREGIKNVFVAEAAKFTLDGNLHNSRLTVDHTQWEDYFEEEVATTLSSSSAISSSTVEVECLSYLQDPDNTLLSLKKYPTLMEMFTFYNTPLPSSAPAERLFSYAGMILQPRRRRLDDALVEALLMIKLNNLPAPSS